MTKKTLFVPPKVFYRPLPKYNDPSLMRDRHNFEHNAIVGASGKMPVMAIFSAAKEINNTNKMNIFINVMTKFNFQVLLVRNYSKAWLRLWITMPGCKN